MKILVCLKQVPHRDARLEVAGAWINEANLKFEINDYDNYGLEAALRIKDANQAEVVVVTIGPDRVVQSLRTALGMGADRAIHVKDPAIDGSDVLGIAKVLAAVAKAESPDLIYMGLMSDDGNFAAVAPMLAELVGMPHTTAAVSIERTNGVVRVDREFDDPLPPDAKDLDVVVNVLFYHDFEWMKVDRAAHNRAIFAALKPGGRYVIVDAHAKAGAGASGSRRMNSCHCGCEVNCAAASGSGTGSRPPPAEAASRSRAC